MSFSVGSKGPGLQATFRRRAKESRASLTRTRCGTVRAGGHEPLTSQKFSSVRSDQPVTAAADFIKHHLKCDAVGIRLIDEDGNVTFKARAGFPDRFCERRDCLSLFRDRCVCAKVLQGEIDPDLPLFTPTGSLVISSVRDGSVVPSGLSDALPHLLGAKCDFQSVVLTRIHVAGNSLGLLHCADRRPGRFCAGEVSWLESVAEEIGRELFYDSLWLPAHSDHVLVGGRAQAVCPVCGRRRNRLGRWVREERLNPRIAWAILQVPRIVCPRCLRFCNSE